LARKSGVTVVIVHEHPNDVAEERKRQGENSEMEKGSAKAREAPCALVPFAELVGSLSDVP
jgi:hypothetical protein